MNRPIILIVDTDLDSRAIFRTALEWRGYSVLDTGEGREALELARQHGPELIIGDFPLQTSGSNQPLTEAQLRGEFQDTRPHILTVTARTFGFERSDEREAADAVLLKPIEPMRILREVERRLGSPNAH